MSKFTEVNAVENFIRDLLVGKTIQVSVAAGASKGGNSGSYTPSLSADGKSVAFESEAGDLLAGGRDGNVAQDVFVRDLIAGLTEAASVRSSLQPSDVVLDHEAVMSSREFLYHGEQEPPYPPEDFSVEDNLKDLEQMDSQHRSGTRYTYTVMNADETEVLGCIYLLPNDDRLAGACNEYPIVLRRRPTVSELT